MKLTKGQRAIILLSVFYVIFIYLAADIEWGDNEDMLRFMIFTLPVWGYWSGVWVLGFGWLLKLWRRIRKFVYALLFIAIVGGIAVSVYKGIKTRRLEELRVQYQASQKQAANRKLTNYDIANADGEWEDIPVKQPEQKIDFDSIEWEPVNIPAAGEKKQGKDDWLWADDIVLEPVNIPAAEEKKPVDDEWGEWEPVNAPVGDAKDEYRELPEALEYELRRIRNINSD